MLIILLFDWYTLISYTYAIQTFATHWMRYTTPGDR